MSHEHAGGERTAPWYPVPPQDVVSVEHPCVVRNIDKAIDTLQGHAAISEMLDASNRDSPLTLMLNPEDVMSRPIRSTSKQTNNILLKVTVPRRTGRRRKRGSQDPFVDSHEDREATPLSQLDARGLLQRLQEDAGRYQVDIVGQVNRTHVFRGLPDFAYSTTSSPFIRKFRETILPFEYEKLKKFEFDLSKGATSNVDIIPPPALSNNDVAFQYLYRQNPTVKRSIDPSGQVTTANTQRIVKIPTHLVSYDISAVPTEPQPNCPPLSDQDPTVHDTVAALRTLFNERPAWTRRALRNKLPTPERKYALRIAIPYVGYLFRSGPWRDGIFKFGFDPRVSPDYRIYQTLMFRLFPVSAEPEGREQENDPNAQFTTTTTPLSGRRHTLPRLSFENNTDPTLARSHIWTGEPPLSKDGKTWMIVDIEDPILARLLDPSTPDAHPPREKCDIYSCGWYGNVTLSIVRTIMRMKMTMMMEGRTDWPSEQELLPLLSLPSHVDSEEDLNKLTLVKDGLGPVPSHLLTEIRAVARNVPWKMDKMRERFRGATGPFGRGEKRVRWDDQPDEDEDDGEGEEQEQDHEDDEDEEMSDYEEGENVDIEPQKE
ncbi:RNA polymerase III transcription factor subunit [Trichophyton equinum CBS 127.97]|uniref:RNA polymerase III transcription factor subunit n=1 Tax=Trichophyton equinum (strain ATCC MYA-4606 / CBS 127.97) TaxID=559882 RepID=F2PU18_TRIEC|nr:RNA polymerase III transcription factor subunit [Trichophyton equinum CBS 127.97]